MDDGRSPDSAMPHETPPPGADAGEVTGLLLAWGEGDPGALEDLLPRVYDELRSLAGSYLRRERSGHTLQTSDLVHEAYLRLVDQQRVSWQNRAHFFGVAAQAMRRILVDHARAQLYAKRGGGRAALPLDGTLELGTIRPPELVALDDALGALEQADPLQARVVELRYFAGLTGEEIAVVLGQSVRSVSRRWRMARAWLYQELAAGHG